MFGALQGLFKGLFEAISGFYQGTTGFEFLGFGVFLGLRVQGLYKGL